MDFQTRNLTVPRGKILFARYLPGTQIPGPFKELGNCPEFVLSRETAKLEHYGSQKGMKTLDDEYTTDSKLTGSVRTDDMRATNMALWMMSTNETVSQTAITSTTETVTADKGDIIQVGRTAARPSGARQITVTSVTPVPTGTAYVENIDYLVNGELGIVEILPSGSIPNAQEIEIVYTAEAISSERIVMGETDAEGELKFIAFNPVGKNHDITIPRAKISPNGDLTMVTDAESPAFQDIGLSITAMKKDDLELAYRDGRPAA